VRQRVTIHEIPPPDAEEESWLQSSAAVTIGRSSASLVGVTAQMTGAGSFTAIRRQDELNEDHIAAVCW
jgi:hypothetical protein